jgi:hypothetical protein
MPGLEKLLRCLSLTASMRYGARSPEKRALGVQSEAISRSMPSTNGSGFSPSWESGVRHEEQVLRYRKRGMVQRLDPIAAKR